MFCIGAKLYHIRDRTMRVSDNRVLMEHNWVYEGRSNRLVMENALVSS